MLDLLVERPGPTQKPTRPKPGTPRNPANQTAPGARATRPACANNGRAPPYGALWPRGDAWCDWQ
eukprot:9673221-Lingulodinium_polyedra.AAC.1